MTIQGPNRDPWIEKHLALLSKPENFYSLAHTTCLYYPLPLFHTIKPPASDDWSKGKASNLKVSHLNCSCTAKKNKVGAQIYDSKALDDVNNSNRLKGTMTPFNNL